MLVVELDQDASESLISPPKPWREADYTRFWEDALLEARATIAKLGDKPASWGHDSCPKVYVYENLPKELRDVSKGHDAAKDCKGWWSHPNETLQNAMRVAYSDVDFLQRIDVDGNRLKHDYYVSIPNSTRLAYPNLYSVPYPSSYHPYGSRNKGNNPPKRKAAFVPSKERSGLMLFLGTSDHGDTWVRKMIRDQCRLYNQSSICGNPKLNRKTALNFLSSKGSYKFCLEPGGDSPWRKSLSDDISFGCIPVVFEKMMDEVAPWHWGAWKGAARVLVPRNDFVDGKIDLQRDCWRAYPRSCTTSCKTRFRDLVVNSCTV
ncbi:hypothetical protein ACHAWF_011022 [Thalassiosira exigua]